jgi:hypothetical protein
MMFLTVQNVRLEESHETGADTDSRGNLRVKDALSSVLRGA